MIANGISRSDTDGTDLAIVPIAGLDMRAVRGKSQWPEQQGDQAETDRHLPCDACDRSLITGD